MNKRFLGRALAGAAALVLGTAAFGASPSFKSPADIMAMSKAQYQRYLQAKKAGAQRSATQAHPLDTTGPVMTKLDLAPSADAERADGQIVYSFAATDDLSGVHWLGIVMTGPSGQQFSTYVDPGMTRTKVSGKAAAPLDLWSEAGEWRVTEVRGGDQANNAFQIPANLEALGNIRVQIRNRRAPDTTPPTLVSGKILTPSASLSTPAKGTEFGAQPLGLSVQVADGGSAVSGINYVYADFCSDWGYCIYMSASTNGVLGVKQATLMPSTEVNELENAPGVYQMRSVLVRDQAGNETVLTSTLFDGETDFSQLFPSTTIELKY